MFRVVCVSASGEASRERFADPVRAHGEYKHLKRSPNVVFLGLYEKPDGARNFEVRKLFGRGLHGQAWETDR